MKRSVCLLLVLTLVLLMPGAKAAVAVNRNAAGNSGFAALVGDDGKTIVSPGVYDKIVCVRAPDLFAAYDAAQAGFLLIDAHGNALTDQLFEAVYMGGDDALICMQNGLYGVLTMKFTFLTPCEYTWMVPNGEGGFLALRTSPWDDTPDGVYLIDKNGRESPTGVKLMSYLSEFTGGLSPALSTDNGRYGYLYAQGQWALRPQYAFADWFVSGRAMAMLDSGSGVIDMTGAWRVTPKFDYIHTGPENSRLIVGVNYQKNVTVFDADTYEERFSFPCDTYAAYVASGGMLICVYTEDQTYVLNADGERVLSLSPEASLFFTPGGYIIVYDGLWGDECARVYDESGAPLTPAYQNLEYFGEREGEYYFQYNRFPVVRGEQTASWNTDSMLCGLIDSRGNSVLPANYVSLSQASQDLILAEGRGGLYLFDYRGKLFWSALF